ncbi:MAG TPA: caspase family protein [Steroidobacteraceae bacterium]|nr:caspase family protein [Steroidobacteraceae bacterium]
MAWPAFAAAPPAGTRRDLEIVECLLPGQVRIVGGRTYLSSRRPTRTTAQDCRVRGGEYVAYDRANLETALKFWMESAQQGDPEAQVTVGEIYERGLGAQPNYEAALIWYKKAADQGYSRALFNLGTLYEQGLGVEADKLKALNLYRQAWGIPDDNLTYERAANQQITQLRTELEKQVADRDEQISALTEQVEQLKAQLQKQTASAAGGAKGTNAELARQAETLGRLVAQLRAEREKDQQRLGALPQTREPAKTPETPPLDPKAFERFVKGLNFGRYYAIIIGNQNYQLLEDLQTPHYDATRAARILSVKYGFNVQMIEDADDVAMLRALNDLAKVVKENDNVLIYYAGHGTRLKTVDREAGYWLPTNAQRPPDDTYWVPNEQISAHLGRLPAKRVLVVADSCYAGLLSTDPGVNVFGRQVSVEYLKYKLPKRSRLLLASGGDEPVLDTGGGGNSVFARAFLDVLEANDDVLPTPSLFERIQDRVKAAAAQNKFTQVPEFRSIKSAGHDVGDFFFVPVKG